ncbi:3-hydroxyacyl-CoA dehydrogenase family protein [Micromonospora inyonensis]|uniref:3-hydroxyacyl-CoA dehydrogenase n=1 Tax=Micromonospora inyonensis TaxID=47866 RepID=A0A1C6SDT6_9ACTN|nr:3-hydroxyacyl-CoA dehydrogenase family protein [Micromonospora inyonensis]SCL27469.1 3-hydroxyacyl-CoA dehydrogenase [Micromonospora inyonensis]
MEHLGRESPNDLATIKRILVVGAGAMGSQIALVCARAGYEVLCHDVAESSLERARKDLRSRSARDVAKGRRDAGQEAAVFRRLVFGTDLDALARDVDLVIEAAVENLDLKRRIFAQLEEVAPKHAIFATNSSSFVPSKLADATSRPDLFCNIHFFNPALVMKCVEIVAGPETSAETVELAKAFVVRIGKEPVVLKKEIPGFIANRILNAVRDEAVFLYENGVASVDSIDAACRTALGYPMGPFELMDLTGIDIGYFTKKARFAETNDPKDAPSRSVTELVERGDLGRKTGRGWYEYAEDGTPLGPA